ncbi:MAG: rhomboid family intramembrane serine protease, partial [Bacteroidales bacterium]|nr:rhomboid family intramembrane serine protease [Bacteroidales bacterium]
FDNSIPVFFLSLALFYFYREVSYQVFFLSYLSTGLLVWLVGREAYHIGASGIIYSLAAFLFVSGILRKNRNLLAISLLVTFLYGSMIWGLLPYDYKISWESHLMGAITGVALAFIYRKYGPEPDINVIPEDIDEEEAELISKEASEEKDFKK